MEITFFQGLWFLLIFVLIAGYFVLDGFDLGAGVLYPFVAKGDEEKAVVRTSIGPVWDGNEVWLLTAGGALFAAFPAAYATTFSGFYLAVMLVLFGRLLTLGWRGGLELLPALLLGVAVGNIYAGIPMSANGDYTGIPLLGLITPFTLLCGLLGLSMFLAQGASWLALKAPKPSDLQARAAKLRFPLQIVSLVLFVAVTAYALLGIQPAMDPLLGAVRWLLAALFVVAIVASVFFAKGKDCDLGAFIAQSGAAALLVLLLAASMFPNFVVASADSVGPAITAMSAASSELTLMWMTIITCVGLPLVLVYHVIIYRTFRGRVKEEDLAHY